MGRIREEGAEFEIALAEFGDTSPEILLSEIEIFQEMLEGKSLEEVAEQPELQMIIMELVRMLVVWDYWAGGVKQ